MLLDDEPGEKCNGLLNRSHTRAAQLRCVGSAHAGATGSGAAQRAHGRRRLRRAAASAFHAIDRARVSQSGSQRHRVNAFADGVTGGNVDGEPYDNRVDLDGHVNTGASLRPTCCRSATPGTSRCRRASTGRASAIAIGIEPGGGPGSLDGDHAYSRFNPAAGVTFSPSPALNLYVGYSEGSRAPTSIELGCADPDAAVQAAQRDGGRSAARPGGDAHVWKPACAAKRGRSPGMPASFMPTTATTSCSSHRADRIRLLQEFRQDAPPGHRARLNAREGRFTGGAGYTLLDATFQSEETVNGTGNSTNDTAAEAAKDWRARSRSSRATASRSIPRHMFKAFADVRAHCRSCRSTSTSRRSSGVFARGNENKPSAAGRHLLPRTRYRTDAYAIVNIGARYDVNKWLQVIAQVNNLFDRHYYTAAQLARPDSRAPATSSRGHFRPSTASSPSSRRRSTRPARRRCTGWERGSSSERAPCLSFIQQLFELGFLERVDGAAGQAVHPPLQLLHRHHVVRRGMADLDFELGGRAPRILPPSCPVSTAPGRAPPQNRSDSVSVDRRERCRWDS